MKETWFSTLMRMVVHAITGAVIAFPLTVIEGIAAATVGAAGGALAARFAAKSSVRSPAIALFGVLGLGLVIVAHYLVVDLPFVPEALGPAQALRTGDAVLFGAGAFAVSLVMRTLSVRQPSFTIAEAALIAGGFATLLITHRHGAIHRPYEIADPLIARGEDPTIALLVVGALAAATIGLLLLSERSLLRSAFHLGVVIALLLAILGTTTMMGLPTPEGGGGALGLQDDDRAARDRQGAEGSRRDSEELDFLDEYPSGGTSPDAVIIFHDDYSAPGGYYYFRQSAFSQFNGRKLVTAMRQDIDADVRNVFPSGRSREVAWVPRTGTDRTEVETTVAMIADNSAPLALEAPARFQPATNPHPQRFRRIYRVRSVSTTAEPMDLLGRPAGDPAWSEEVRAGYLAFPDDPRYRALAERIVEQLPEHLRADPWARALAITQYLGEHGTYSLRSRHAGADDPTAHFLFGDLVGYCVHFAHAAVYLMRAAGVPSRVGTGYAVPEANRQGGSALLLRNADQHAWPEVFLGAAPPPDTLELNQLRAYADARAAGTADQLSFGHRMLAIALVYTAALEHLGAPLPEDSFAPDASTAESTAAEIERIAQSVSMTSDELIAFTIEKLVEERGPPSEIAGWVVADVAPQNVLDPPGEPPDPQLQQLLAEMARGSTPVDDMQPPRPMSELMRSLFGRWTPRELAFLVLVLIGGPFTFLYGVKFYRRLAPSFSRRPRVIYRGALDALSDVGLRRAWGESPESFATRVRAQTPSLARLTDRHLAAAFGMHDVADAMVGDAQRVARELTFAIPFWRRALGWFNPFTWILTR